MINGFSDPRVAVATTGRPDYGPGAEERVWRGLNRAARALGCGADERGPLADIVPPGSRVLIKPNLVLHPGRSPHGANVLLTHRSVIDAALRAAYCAGAAEIVVGDAPIQSCDFRAMLRDSGLDDWSRRASKQFSSFAGIRDFRASVAHGGSTTAETRGGRQQFTLFDLGTNSMLEPITDGEGRFRVTCYDPKVLQRTHAPGRHQYLIARDVLEADVVINLPKLKMHRRAGITCALKNLIGINGSKDFLPHHRIGGSSAYGDCYPGNSRTKTMLEYVLDRQNCATSAISAAVWGGFNLGLTTLLKMRGDCIGVEGSWSGNDTIWRTCLDLNRILLYGTVAGALAETPQRKAIHFVDAVIAGQGKGPLEPSPLPLGLVLLGQNAAAVDWVGAFLLGYAPERIPLTQHAFDVRPYPIADFLSSDVEITGDLGRGKADDIFESWIPVIPSSYPPGWADAAAHLSQTSGAVRVEQQVR